MGGGGKNNRLLPIYGPTLYKIPDATKPTNISNACLRSPDFKTLTNQKTIDQAVNPIDWSLEIAYIKNNM